MKDKDKKDKKKKKERKRPKKPSKDYAGNEKYQIFLTCSANGANNEPKKKFIMYNKMPELMKKMEIPPLGDDGKCVEEINAIDKDYKGNITFKNWMKFYKRLVMGGNEAAYGID